MHAAAHDNAMLHGLGHATKPSCDQITVYDMLCLAGAPASTHECQHLQLCTLLHRLAS
jgi:hypothetical protein